MSNEIIKPKDQNSQSVTFEADKPIEVGMVCVIAGFNFFDWTAPIQHLEVDGKFMDEIGQYYQSKKSLFDAEHDKSIPSSVKAAYATYLHMNGGASDSNSQQIQQNIYNSHDGIAKLSDFYGSRAMVCGEASIFVHRLLSEDIPVQLAFGFLDDEPHAFLLVKTENGIGLFDVNNGIGENPYFVQLTEEQVGMALQYEFSPIRIEYNGKNREYLRLSGGENRLYRPLRRKQV